MPNDPLTNAPIIRTFTGKDFSPINPDPATLDLVDIAHALSNLCRFTGHVTELYSVAEHCVRGALAIREAGGDVELQKAFLMHDAAEAYMGDLSNPIKLIMPEYRSAEDYLMKVIKQRFQLSGDEELWREVHRWDLIMLATEARDLMGNPDWPVLKEIKALGEQIIPWTPFVAKERFRNRAYLLGIL